MLTNMEKSLAKFKELLENEEKKLVEDETNISYLRGIRYTISLLNKKREDIAHSSQAVNIESVSNILKSYDLTLEEKSDIILYFLKYNIYAGLLEGGTYTKGFDLSKYDFKDISIEKVEDLLITGKLQDFLLKEDDELTPQEVKERNELEKAIKELSNEKNNSMILLQYLTVKNHFFDCYPYLSDIGIDCFITVLKSLGVSSDIIDYINNYLENECSRLRKGNRTQTENLLVKYYQGLKKITKREEKRVLDYQNLVFKIKKVRYEIMLKALEIKLPEDVELEELLGDADIMDLNSIAYGSALFNFLAFRERAKFRNSFVGDFTILGETLGAANFTKSELTDFIFYILKSNIEMGILDEKAKLTVSDKKVMNIDIVECVKKRNLLKAFINEDGGKEVESSNVYETITPALSEDLSLEDLKEAHKVINIHYFQKTNLDEEDIRCVTYSLDKLGLSPVYTRIVENTLRKRYLKPVKQKEDIDYKRERVDIKLKPLISKREYRRMEEELNTYYNFDQGFPIRYLSSAEIIYCLGILRTLNYPDNVINKFLADSLKYSKDAYVNPLVRYKDLFMKLKYYMDKNPDNEKLKSIIEEVENVFAKVMICSDEDYEFYKDYIAMELKDAEELLINHTEYEIEETIKRG